jgi:hypothetical protein
MTIGHFSGARTVPALLLCAAALLTGCATPPGPAEPERAQLPLQRAWYEGRIVFYVTTDVSDAQVARDKKANFAPRLAQALKRAEPPSGAAAFDKVYSIANFKQPSVFASAPQPIGPGSADVAYSPLWRMTTVTWLPGRTPRMLDSEEAVLAAAEAGDVRLVTTDVLLNCPIVHLGPLGGLEGVSLIGVRP